MWNDPSAPLPRLVQAIGGAGARAMEAVGIEKSIDSPAFDALLDSQALALTQHVRDSRVFVFALRRIFPVIAVCELAPALHVVRVTVYPLICCSSAFMSTIGSAFLFELHFLCVCLQCAILEALNVFKENAGAGFSFQVAAPALLRVLLGGRHLSTSPFTNFRMFFY